MDDGGAKTATRAKTTGGQSGVEILCGVSFLAIMRGKFAEVRPDGNDWCVRRMSICNGHKNQTLGKSSLVE